MKIRPAFTLICSVVASYSGAAAEDAKVPSAPPAAASENLAEADPAVPAPRTSRPGWMQQHENYLSQAQKGGVEVLFIGDSITKAWVREGREVWTRRFVPLRAANFGIAGDSTQHVLWRVQNGELSGINPKVLVLLIGTNNLGTRHTPENTSRGVIAIVDEVQKQLPETHVLLIGILPRHESPEHPDRERIRRLNQIISELGNRERVIFLDVGDRFIQPDGKMSAEITPDFTHLSAKGYEVYADALEPTIKTLLAKFPAN